jgi:hypothetical protein
MVANHEGGRHQDGVSRDFRRRLAPPARQQSPKVDVPPRQSRGRAPRRRVAGPLPVPHVSTYRCRKSGRPWLLIRAARKAAPVETAMKGGTIHAAMAAPARTPSANTATAIISLVAWLSTCSSSPPIIARHDSAGMRWRTAIRRPGPPWWRWRRFDAPRALRYWAGGAVRK